MAVSDTPWSKFTAADYSVEQWHRACIVHDHDGPPTSKDQRKLPVREPDGTLNRNGVHAAAAALAGARGGIKLSVPDRIKANKALAGYYSQLGEKPPAPKKPAFLNHALMADLASFAGVEDDPVADFLAHYGVKGMKWKNKKAGMAPPPGPDQHFGKPTPPNNSKVVPPPNRKNNLHPDTKKLDIDPSASKKDADWARSRANAGNIQKVANKSHAEFQDRFKKLMNEPRFKDIADLIKAQRSADGPSKNPKVQAFFRQAKKMHDDIWAKHSKEVFGDPPSKGLRLIAVRHPDGSVSTQLAPKPTPAKKTSPAQAKKRNVKKVPHTVVHGDDLSDFLAHASSTNACVIVAIPSADDPVWRVSSEKVPHITLLYLGDDIPTDDSRLAWVFGEMAAAASSCGGPFGLPVMSRGNLGPDQADVVFFDPEGARKLTRLRSRMLYSPTIKGMYNSVKQFPLFTPHLTLGYPQTPARSGGDPLRYITFDRLALWSGDYSGPELKLRSDPMQDGYDDAEAMDVAYHSDVNAFLAHYGIKGMRWGFRRERGSDGTVTSAVKEGHVEGHETGHHGGGGSEHISVDAERFAVTRGKSVHQMSDREIKEANARAQAIKQYHDLFSENPNKELQQKVERLRLEKEYGKLQAELHPTALQRVARLVTANAHLFGAVHKYATSKQGKATLKTLKQTLGSSWKAANAAANTPRPPKAPKAPKAPRTKRNKRNSGAPPHATPTSHATTVRATHVGTHRRPTVHNITTLPPPGAPPLALP